MVLSKEQKEELLKRLKEGKEKKAQEKLTEEKKQADQVKAQADEVKARVEQKKQVEPEIIPFEEHLPSAPLDIPTRKTFYNNESKKNKYYNKETGQPLMKIKLYREPTNNAIIDNLINSLSQTNQAETKKEAVGVVGEPKILKETNPKQDKLDARKIYIDNLSKSFF
jgi:hypothetical protein